MVENKNIKKLIDDFITNAIIQGEATYQGDHKKGNKASNKLFKIGAIMEQNIAIAKEMLDVLLFHEHINVKIWAAGKAMDLKYRDKEAEKILEEISKMPDVGILGLNAKMSLKVRKEKNNKY